MAKSLSKGMCILEATTSAPFLAALVVNKWKGLQMILLFFLPHMKDSTATPRFNPSQGLGGCRALRNSYPDCCCVCSPCAGPCLYCLVPFSCLPHLQENLFLIRLAKTSLSRGSVLAGKCTHGVFERRVGSQIISNW